MPRQQYPQYNQSAYSQFQPGTFFGGQSINAAPRNVAYVPGTGPGTGRTAQRVAGSWDGLNKYYALQDRSRPAFANPRGILGMGNSAEEEGRVSTNRGMMWDPNRGYVQDTLYNRTTGYGSQRNPYSSRTMMQYDEGEGPQQPAMTEPQQRWAQKAQEKMSGIGALGKVGEKMESINPMMGWLNKIGNAAASTFGAKASGAQNPYLGTREQNIANAKAAGEFDKIRDEFNDKNPGAFMSDAGDIYNVDYNVDKNGRIDWARDLGNDESGPPRDWRQVQNFVKTKAEERALQRGSFVTPQTLSKEDEAAGVKSRVAMENPYGRGSFTRYADPSKKPQSMVKDDFGNWIPMNQYLERKKYVQGTKGMA